MAKKILLGIALLVALVLLGAGGFLMSLIGAYDKSMSKVYDVPVPDLTAPDFAPVLAAAQAPSPAPEEGAEPVEPTPAEAAAAAELASLTARYERGKHLSESLGGCQACHGEDLATPDPNMIDMGPLGKLPPPNISMGGLLANYSDGELHRLLLHGIKRDGTGAIFMPSADFGWWSDEDLLNTIGFLRTMPAVERQVGPMTVGTLAKILDRQDALFVDVARRIDHGSRDTAPAPSEDASYGDYIARLCTGCHGPTLSGGPIPGAPPSMPTPLNITPHETGIAHYTFADFDKLMREAIKPDGSALDPFMNVVAMGKMTDVEMKALWNSLQATPPREFGGR